MSDGEHSDDETPAEEQSPAEDGSAEKPRNATISDRPLMTGLDLPPPASVPPPRPVAIPTTKPAPTISEVTPSEGPVIGGTRLVLNGSHLYRESIVRIGGEIAQPLGASEPNELRVMTPPFKRPATVDVTVQNPGHVETVVEKAFRYVSIPAPKIVSVAPNRVGLAGGDLSVVGENFVETSVVVLGTKDIEATFVDSKNLDFKAPPGTNGAVVDVTVRNPDGKDDTARRAFVYDERY